MNIELALKLWSAVCIIGLFLIYRKQVKRNKREGEFKLFIVGKGEVYFNEAWGIVKGRARDEKKYNTVYLSEKTNGKFFNVDFSRWAEFEASVKAAFNL